MHWANTTFPLGLTSDDWRAVGRSASHVSPVKGRSLVSALGAALGRLGRSLGGMLTRSEPARKADGPSLDDGDVGRPAKT